MHAYFYVYLFVSSLYLPGLVIFLCPSDETLNLGPMYRETSRPVHVKNPHVSHKCFLSRLNFSDRYLAKHKPFSSDSQKADIFLDIWFLCYFNLFVCDKIGFLGLITKQLDIFVRNCS